MAEPTMERLTLRDKQWRYKGEGNANVVLFVPEDGTVVRVAKVDGHDDETGALTVVAETLRARADYCRALQLLFLGEYVDMPVTAAVATEELREMDAVLRSCRPADRRHKGLGWAGGLVAVCPDYTVLRGGGTATVYCAEIKPKQGWTHKADRGTKCAFCANQYLKLSTGATRSVSVYCPLDLFSGRADRMKHAVRCLLRTPQNNLKMFRDGEPVPNDGHQRTAREACGSVDRFCALIAAALIGHFGDPVLNAVGSIRVLRPDDDWCTPQPVHRFLGLPCDYSDADLRPSGGGVLNHILRVQRLQTCGFDAVCRAYERLELAARLQYGHVTRLFRAADCGGEFAIGPVDSYLHATTARDCSVFVTFCESDDAAAIAFDGRRYRVRVKVSDLDPKPLSCVEKHRKRNENVLRACRLALEGGEAS